MPSTLCKPVSGPLKPLLDRDHLERGEPLLPFPVLPQPHQLGRRLHRAHSGIELVLAVAVPMDDHRQVAGRSAEHTSELQSLIRFSYAFFCLTKKRINAL